MKKKIVFSALVIVLSVIISRIEEDANTTFDQFCQFHNYPVESHEVVTDDGYILKLFRNQAKNSNITMNKPPVLIIHGLMGSSDFFIINEESKAPALMLANAGYDVWTGNVRGNKYSRSHKVLNPDKDNEFWDFSWQEISDFDLPAMMNYISDVTNRKVNYIGHSQGSLIMFAALANNTSVKNKLQSFTTFGPAAFINNMNAFIVDILVGNPYLLEFLEKLNVLEFFPEYWVNKRFGYILCEYFPNFCVEVSSLVTTTEPSLENTKRFKYLGSHEPSGTSLRNMKHFHQMINWNKNTIRKFDFGKEENIKRYGKDSPPELKLEDIVFDKMFMFRANADRLSTMKDSQKIIDILEKRNPSLQDNVYEMGHISFFIGDDMTFMKKVISNLDTINMINN